MTGTDPTVTRPSGDEGGWTTLWVLGLATSLLFLGGLTLDLGRAFSERRNLAAAADAAAAAGTSGIDEAGYRAGGPARLNPRRAESLAQASLSDQQDSARITGAEVSATTDTVTVTARSTIDLTLVRVLMGGQPLLVTVTATAHPRRST